MQRRASGNGLAINTSTFSYHRGVILFLVVTEFAVAPAYHGNECGKALLQRVVADAETQGLNAGTPVPGRINHNATKGIPI